MIDKTSETLDEYQDDDGLPEPTYNIPDVQESSFTEEKRRNLEQLRNTFFLPKIISKIEETKLSSRCKRNLEVFAQNHLDSTFVLAHFKDNLYPKLIFKINAIMLQVGIWPDDLNNPDFIVIMENIESHFDAFITRAVGGKPLRERIAQSEERVKQTVETRNITEDQRLPKQDVKKRWF